MNKKKPDWIKVKALSDESYRIITDISNRYNLHTVCQEALCPNINECWSARTATFLLLGDICTRNCRFCSVRSGNPQGYPDDNEPDNIAKAAQELDLKYAVLTSVDRDDLSDGGSAYFARTVKEIKKLDDRILVEVLIPDFQGNIDSLGNIVEAKPDIIGHNIETVERLTPSIRDKRANYRLSLEVLKSVKKIDNSILTKSSLQLGFGETENEIKRTLLEIRESYIDIVTIGQYLRPGKKQIPVSEYIIPDKFKEYEKFARTLGFLYVVSGPFVRSSYKAAEGFFAAKPD